eukprot:gene5811-7871_t
MNFLRISIAALMLAMAGGLVAQDATEKARMERIREEVARRRKLLETAHGERGIVFAPYRYEDKWYAEAHDLVIEDMALVTAGQMVATYARKEVMISGRVIQKKITVQAPKVTGDAGWAKLRAALEAQGLVLVPVGSKSLALIEATEAGKA